MKLFRVITLLILFLNIVAFGQEEQASQPATQEESPKISVDNLFQIYNNIYSRARRYGDNDMAINAIYNILALTPNNVAIYDSLALMYFEKSDYAQAALVTNDILAAQPDDELALEIAALSYENLGIKAKALENYESLYLENNDNFTLYKVAFIQYELERFKESQTSVEILMDKPEIKETMVYHRTSDNKNQQVSMEASLLNLSGLIQMRQENKGVAREKFEAALALYPEFELAKKNLASLDN